MQYRYAIRRTLVDFLDINNFLNIPNHKPFILILEKLSNLNYLNKINQYLLIKPFRNYPNSTILGKKWGGDLLSKDKTSNPYGTFDSNLVNRGNPIERLGLVDAILITLMCKERIIFYNFKIDSKFLNKLINTNCFVRIFIFLLVLPMPSKIELMHYSKIIETFINIFFCKKLFKREKLNQLGFALFCVLMMPIEYIRMRIFRISILSLYLKSPNFINEL